MTIATLTNADSLAATLKSSTAAAHRHAETRALQKQLAGGAVAPVTLTRYLQQLMLVHSHLESRLDELSEVRSALAWSDEHRHSDRLRADLALADAVDATALPATQAFLDAIDQRVAMCPAAIVGVFYVLEGSMNGNRFIVRALAAQPSLRAIGFSYFDPYGEAQRPSWLGFRARFDELPLSDEEKRIIVETALETFDAIAAISDAVVE